MDSNILLQDAHHYLNLVMNTEKLKIVLQHELYELDYTLHACRQTLKLLQLNTSSNGGSPADLISHQQNMCKQLQDQHDKLVEQLAGLG